MKSLEDSLQSTAKVRMWFTGPEFFFAKGNVIEEIDLEPSDNDNEETKKKDSFFAALKKLAKRKEKFYSSWNWNKIYRAIASIRRLFNNC